MKTWTSKHDPQNIDELILKPEIKDFLKKYTSENTVPNLVLYGNSGIGKSTLCRLLTKEINATTLFICGSQESGIDTVRNKIEKFAKSRGFPDSEKVIIIDEADGMEKGGKAQQALRNTITEHENDTKFLFTCNNLQTIRDAIQSRCKPLALSYDIKDVAKRIFDIIKKEKVNLDEKSKKEVIQIIKNNFPDIRKVLNTVEHYTATGEFVKIDSDEIQQTNEIIKNILNYVDNGEPKKAREYYIKSSTYFNSDYQKLIKGIIDYVEDAQEQLLAGMFHYRISNTLDGEIQFYTFLLALYNYRVNNIHPINIMEFK